jgi:hypothetical protein
MLVPANQLPNFKVFLAIFVKVFPLLNFLPHFLLCLPSLSLCSGLSLSTADDFIIVIHWNVDELRTSHVVGGIFEETASHKSACCISTSEDAVAATRTIRTTAGGDIEDGAVDGKIDRKVRI